jgi:S-adenosylhomocysteine hydrolase
MRVVLGVALVGLVVFVGCGPSSPQEKAIAALKKLGGEVFDRAGGEVEFNTNKEIVGVCLRRSRLRNTKVTDAGLVHLKGMTKLVALNFDFTKVTDEGVVHLKEMTSLQAVHFNHTKVSDAGLVHLKGLTDLFKLDLEHTNVTEEGFKQLQQAFPKCRIYSNYNPGLLR